MKIALLLSGGVDSSVALRLLKEQGHEVRAFYLKIWLEDELSYLGNCPWEEDITYARAVCEAVQVPLEILSLQKEYWDTIVAYTLSEVRAGRTPNPDVLCNNRIKFGLSLEKIGPHFEKIASGHYARLESVNGKVQLLQSPDPIKDQTYFLAHMSQKQLQRVLFPLGNLTKKEVRRLAIDYDLPNKDRKDSQGICFLGKFAFRAFLKAHLGEKIGDLIEYETGKKVGTHPGFWFFTLGQRKGIGLSGGPWYVVSKDIEKNLVFVSKQYHASDVNRREFFVSSFNWILEEKPRELSLQVKVRHGPKFYDCSLDWISEDHARVILSENDQGIAPGQFAVFYDGEVCLGSGVIG